MTVSHYATTIDVLVNYLQLVKALSWQGRDCMLFYVLIEHVMKASLRSLGIFR